jgi:hypothetical protein
VTSSAVRSTIGSAVARTRGGPAISQTFAVAGQSTSATVSAAIDCTGPRATVRETLPTGTTVSPTIDCTRRRATIRETFTTVRTGPTIRATIRATISTPVRRTGCCASVSQTLAVASRGRHVVVIQTHDAAPSESAGASLVRTVELA